MCSPSNQIDGDPVEDLEIHFQKFWTAKQQWLFAGSRQRTQRENRRMMGKAGSMFHIRHRQTQIIDETVFRGSVQSGTEPYFRVGKEGNGSLR